MLRLARMAVSARHQGQGIGKRLLSHVFMLAHEQADRAGCVGIVVDAQPAAVSFYRLYGFEDLALLEGALPGEDSPIAMYLELGSIPRA